MKSRLPFQGRVKMCLHFPLPVNAQRIKDFSALDNFSFSFLYLPEHWAKMCTPPALRLKMVAIQGPKKTRYRFKWFVHDYTLCVDCFAFSKASNTGVWRDSVDRHRSRPLKIKGRVCSYTSYEPRNTSRRKYGNWVRNSILIFMSFHVTPSNVTSCHALPCHAMYCHAMSCHETWRDVTWHDILCHVMLCHVTSRHAMLR